MGVDPSGSNVWEMLEAFEDAECLEGNEIFVLCLGCFHFSKVLSRLPLIFCADRMLTVESEFIFFGCKTAADIIMDNMALSKFKLPANFPVAKAHMSISYCNYAPFKW